MIVVFKRDFEFFIEVGLKYFILGVFLFGILLFGCFMIYGFIGVINFEELVKIFIGYEIILFGV